MEFHVPQTEFSAALALANAVADRRVTGQPILGNVLITARKDNNVEIAATDMTISIAEVVVAEVVKVGALTIGARYLHDVVKTLPKGKPLNVKAMENHWARLSIGRSEFKLMGQAPADFPALPSPKKSIKVAMVPVDALAELVDKTVFSVSTDEARVNLNGVLFESNGELGTMVSTDGHRLTKLSLPLAGPKLERGIIIPRKGMLEIKRILDRLGGGQVGVTVDGQHIFLQTDTMTLSVKLNNVVFPPYEQVIPKKYDRRVTADRAELVDMLTRAEVMAPEKTATVRVQLAAGSMQVTADNPDLGVAHQEIEVEYQGDPLVAGFNARYMLDILGGCESQRVTLDFQGELDPCVIRPVEGSDYLGVVMPMRI
jgi:DNA polymerase-3 subunit beta